MKMTADLILKGTSNRPRKQTRRHKSLSALKRAQLEVSQYEWVNSSVTSNQNKGQTQTGHPFKASFERPEKREIESAIPGLVFRCFIQYTTTAH